MTTLNKILLGVIAVLLAVVIISYNSCSKNKAAFAGLSSIVSTQADTISTYKTKTGQLVVEKQAALSDKAGIQAFLDSKTQEAEDLKKQLADAKITLKNLSSENTVVTNTGIGKTNPPIIVHVHDTTILKQPEWTFNTNTRYYNISGVVDSSIVKFNQLSFPDSLSIVVGYKQKNFLSRKVFTVTAENSNIYSHTIGLDNITQIKDKSIFGNPLFLFGIGFFVGFIGFQFVK